MQKVKILVVEDESILALDIQGYLQSFGYHVAALADKAEIAIKLASSTSPIWCSWTSVSKAKWTALTPANESGKRSKSLSFI